MQKYYCDSCGCDVDGRTGWSTKIKRLVEVKKLKGSPVKDYTLRIMPAIKDYGDRSSQLDLCFECLMRLIKDIKIEDLV
ncbi:MAG TPA: hypothetical protein ENH82_19045 [bacterium]|nr:hypothetical protein [bacterium]